ncbi:hypothetical protein E2R56_04235 [Rhodococcus qingshengii]|nr:hypothetical protein E2R56_04235 [Rhodococcus qingshengii]
MKLGTAIKKEQLPKKHIQSIRTLYSTGDWSHQRLAEKYGVSKHQIRKSVKGVTKTKPTVDERFWSKVKKGNPNECWEWLAAKTSNGYGTFKYNGKTVNSHKFAYQITNGVCVPSRFHVCHSCDEPSCVNPNHLAPGTPKRNVQGMIESGHHYKGGSKPKLNEVQTLEVMFYNDLGIKHSNIARFMGIRGSTVKRVLEKDALQIRNQWFGKERTK